MVIIKLTDFEHLLKCLKKKIEHGDISKRINGLLYFQKWRPRRDWIVLLYVKGNYMQFHLDYKKHQRLSVQQNVPGTWCEMTPPFMDKRQIPVHWNTNMVYAKITNVCKQWKIMGARKKTMNMFCVLYAGLIYKPTHLHVKMQVLPCM